MMSFRVRNPLSNSSVLDHLEFYYSANNFNTDCAVKKCIIKGAGALCSKCSTVNLRVLETLAHTSRTRLICLPTVE